MANQRKVGLKIEIDGEKEYKQAISELNKGNQVLASELRKVSEQYKGNEDSIEALNARGDVLRRQLQQQEDKVKTLRAALKNAASQVGEADKRTEEWQIQLNNAETQEIKLRRALDETNKEIEQQGEATEEATKEMTGLGDTIDSVTDKFGIHLPDAAKEALNGVEGFSAGSVAKLGAVAAAAAAVIGTIKELHEMTLEAAEQADALLTRSAQTGLSTDLLQGLDYAQMFTDFDNLDQVLVRVTTSMDAARDGAEKQAAAFEALGVSVTNADGTLKNNFDTFLELIDALGNVENATERDALANDLFGKSYAEMKPLIDAGTGALREYMKQAKETGKVLTEDQIKVLGEVDDAHQELIATITAEKNKLAVEYAPAAKASMETFAHATQVAGDALVNSGLISNLASVVSSIASILDTGTSLIEALPDWINPIENVSQELKGLAIVAATVADFMTATAGLMPWNWGSGMFKQGIGAGSTESNLQRILNHNRDTSGPILNAYNAAGTDNWRGGLTWVGEGGPELVSLPRGSQIYSNQESMQIATSGGTDTRAMEQFLSEGVGLLRDIRREFSGLQVKRRMA